MRIYWILALGILALAACRREDKNETPKVDLSGAARHLGSQIPPNQDADA
ncbi:MAG: hypothetical protein IPH16_17360 [Haliscomenobacter sp.]|nr:hypothetical protein [Haliscomenobacter sp.]